MMSAVCSWAQERRVLQEIGINDTTYVYAPKYLGNIREEMMRDSSRTMLTAPEMNQIRALLNSTTTRSRRQLTPQGYENGFFVEIRNGTDKPFGCFFTKKGYTTVPNNKFEVATYRYPKKEKAAFRALVEKYQRPEDYEPSPLRFDNYPMNSTCRTMARCLFSGFVPFLSVTFYVCLDSSSVIPVSYIIAYKSKKHKVRAISRQIPIWEQWPLSRIDSEGNIFYFNEMQEEVAPILKYEPSENALTALHSLFPTWPQMTDQERMRMLDDYILGHQKKRN